MPVSSIKKVEDPGETQATPPLNGSRLREKVEQFRQHHANCSSRRANGVSHEIRVEAMHTERLQGKYFDNLRQQQAISGRVEGTGAANSTRAHLANSSENGENGSTVSRACVCVCTCVYVCVCARTRVGPPCLAWPACVCACIGSPGTCDPTP